MTDEPSTINDNFANGLFAALKSDADFTIPAVDLTGPEFQIPGSTGNALYEEVTRLTEEDLTSRTVDGGGMFDALMQSLGAHIREEYQQGRITGKEYAQAYLSMTQTALSVATQYLLGRDQAYWGAQAAQKQAQAAEAQVVQSRVNAEISKAQLQMAKTDAHTAAANYALAKLKLGTESGQQDLQKKALEKATYEVTSLLPAQLIQVQEQTSQITAQKDQVLYQTSAVLPSQRANVDADTAAKDYQTQHILPAQLVQMQEQTSQITAQKDQVLYQTNAVLPSQRANVDADTAIKAYQSGHIMPAQKVGIEEDNAAKVFNVANILPAQHTGLKEQNEAHRAKTLDTRSDGTTPVAGAIGVQKDLQKQQIDSYKNDSQYKVAKMLMDAWITQKSLDEGITQPDSVTNANIDSAMTSIRTTTGLGN